MRYKTFDGEIKSIDKQNYIIEHALSVEVIDRDNELLLIDGARIDNYRRNPVVLWMHGLDSSRGALPIGKNLSINLDTLNTPKRIIGITKFYTDDFSQKIFQMYSEGYLRAWSIRFLPKTQSTYDEKLGARKYPEWELLEYSAVPIPANPEALVQAKNKGYITNDEIMKWGNFIEGGKFMIKGVIPYKQTPLADKDEEWDGPAEIREATIDDLKIMCAWFDSENPDVKSSYKLPHHKARGHACVWRGVVAAMAALLGARGGVDIPEDDRREVYNHLAKHYEDFGEEAPEFKSYIDTKEVEDKKVLDKIPPEWLNLFKLLNEEEIRNILNEFPQKPGEIVAKLKLAKALKGVKQ